MKTLSLKEIDTALDMLPSAYENRGRTIPIHVQTRLEQLCIVVQPYNAPSDKDVKLNSVSFRTIVFKSVVYVSYGNHTYEWEIESWS